MEKTATKSVKKRNYLKPETSSVRYWKTRELCQSFGIDFRNKRETAKAAVSLYQEQVKTGACPEGLKKLVKKACVFQDIGRNLFQKGNAGLAQDILLTHPLRSLSREENLILAGALGIINRNKAGEEQEDSLLKDFLSKESQKQKAKIVADIVLSVNKQTEISEKENHLGLEVMLRNFFLCQLETIRMLLKEKNYDNPDFIHDLRVSFRKMDAVSEVFSQYLTPEWKEVWRPYIKKYLKLLGAVRDVDIMKEKADAFLKDKKKEREELAPFWKLTENRRKQKVAELKNALEGIDFTDSLEAFQASFGKPFLLPRIDKDGKLLRPGEHDLQNKILREQYEAVQTYAHWVWGLLVPEPLLHQLRLALKNFRYGLEFYREQLSSDMRMALSITRDLQDILGTLHDYDVLGDAIRQAQAQSENPEQMEDFLLYSVEGMEKSYLDFQRRWRSFTDR